MNSLLLWSVLALGIIVFIGLLLIFSERQGADKITLAFAAWLIGNGLIALMLLTRP